MICSHEKTKKIIGGLWQAICSVQAAIDALEDIGLSVDGCTAPEKPGVSALYAAMTAADQAIQDAFGIPRQSPYQDEASMLLSDARKHELESANLPARLERALLDIADTARKKAMVGRKPSDGAVPYEVTLSMTGGITVMASGSEEAMSAANALPDSELLEGAAWDGASATDAYPAG